MPSTKVTQTLTLQKIQEMEERRIVRMGESMKTYAEVDRQVTPILGKCLDGIVKAAESIDQKNDSQLVIEAYKSGFAPPGDIEFEDYTQSMKRTVSENSLSNSRDGKSELKFGSKPKGKLWPFIKKNKSPKQQKEPLSHRFNEFMTSKPKIHCFRSLKRGVSSAAAPCVDRAPVASLLPASSRAWAAEAAVEGPCGLVVRFACTTLPLSRVSWEEAFVTDGDACGSSASWCGDSPAALSDLFSAPPQASPAHLCLRLQGATPEDFSNLPPEQRRKKLQQKVDELNKEIQKEMDQRDAITKMKDVYLKNPQMGDPASLDHKLAEASHSIDKLRLEAQKFEAWLAEVEGRLPARGDQARRQSGMYDAQNPPAVANCAQDRESPDGSYTEEQSQESEVKVLATDFDDEFDDEEPLPAIGTCRALYTFEGQNEGTISVAEGETLYVIEEDKGDGWTRIRRDEDGEGYVPTSYVEVSLDRTAKGAKTYI
ncbi:Formin-binding protein 1 [Galemys pyrenaicus]|uniref:Formin-binding protein 1 n=1 Tax=Galemys pyrenaicus TaxID=202257 RepID=A0A8J6AD01_GALPY|nr:Formin-binding protein 1 [Galemys pyrenaicus]